MDPQGDVYRANVRQRTVASSRSKFARLFTDWRFVVRAVRFSLGLPVPLRTEDRRVLENIIFPYLLSEIPRTGGVLFVGCNWYTKHYRGAFFPAHDFWTIDVDPQTRKFAGKQHVVGALEDLGKFFQPSRFDLIICDGVYGFGLDTREQCERAFAACYTCLRPKGLLVLGWTDVPERTPVPLEDIEALKRFQKVAMPPFGGAWRYVTQTPYRHTYDFLGK